MAAGGCGSPATPFTWAGGAVEAVLGSAQVRLNGDSASDSSVHARQWALCLEAAAALASDPSGPVPVGLPAPDEVCLDLAGRPVAFWDDAEITASEGSVVIAGDRRTPRDARRFAWCLLAAAGIADNAAWCGAACLRPSSEIDCHCDGCDRSRAPQAGAPAQG